MSRFVGVRGDRERARPTVPRPSRRPRPVDQQERVLPRLRAKALGARVSTVSSPYLGEGRGVQIRAVGRGPVGPGRATPRPKSMKRRDAGTRPICRNPLEAGGESDHEVSAVRS